MNGTSPATNPLNSELVANLFSRSFRGGILPNLATSANPAHGFDPTRIEGGTEVVWISNPAQLGIPFGAQVSPLWKSGLGLVAFRNPALEVVGGIFIHSGRRNPWNFIQKDAFQCLGGLMIFPHSGSGAKNAEQLYADVIAKGEAMGPKWLLQRINAMALGIPADPSLGGGKSTASHPAGETGKMHAVQVTASVAKALGIYIGGSDQNMSSVTCGEFAKVAPHNFMGVVGHPTPAYAGMGDPSPWTARGVYHAIAAATAKFYGDKSRLPIFIQGYGNVSRPLVEFLQDDGYPITGIIDSQERALVRAREDGLECPLYLLVREGTEEPESSFLQTHNIRVVRSLEEALRLHPETVCLSPNAGTHMVTESVADYVIGSQIKMIIGAANNLLDVVNGSVDTLAWKLQRAHVFVPHDSETNQMGALSVVVTPLGLSEDQLKHLARGIGDRTLESIALFNQGTPPQLGRAKVAHQIHNQLVFDGMSVGGYYDIG